MKAAIHTSNFKHQCIHAVAMAEGLRRHDIIVELFEDNPPCHFDFLVFWGWRKARIWSERGYKCLIMERGYIGDRFAWTSLGWNGLNGNASFNAAADTGGRFNAYYGDLVEPWRDQSGPAVIMSQVAGDMSLIGIDYYNWLNETYVALKQLGHDVYLRKHPLTRPTQKFPNIPIMEGTLNGALDNAGFIVTYNSNSGVDSVIRGVPAISLNRGSIAYPVTSHDLTNPIIKPNREQWLIDLSWRQWSLDEIKSGLVWEYIKPVDLKHVPITALVLGGGPNVWQEAEHAFDNYKIDYVIAINNSIQDFPGHVDMAITLHPVKMAAWLKNRKDRGYPDIKEIVAHKEHVNCNKILDYKWPEMKYSGSSGLFAAKAALEIAGADKVILAGVPMNNSPHYYKSGDKLWNDCNAFIPAWKSALPRIKDRVRSYSGFTESLLGPPTEEWANG